MATGSSRRVQDLLQGATDDLWRSVQRADAARHARVCASLRLAPVAAGGRGPCVPLRLFVRQGGRGELAAGCRAARRPYAPPGSGGATPAPHTAPHSLAQPMDTSARNCAQTPTFPATGTLPTPLARWQRCAATAAPPRCVTPCCPCWSSCEQAPPPAAPRSWRGPQLRYRRPGLPTRPVRAGMASPRRLLLLLRCLLLLRRLPWRQLLP